MLIKALCEYYDILAKAGKVLPAGYSNVKIHYLVCLTHEGQIAEIINYQNKEEIAAGKGKLKEKWVPQDVMMPQRTEKTGIESNFIEHRPAYLFGLNWAEEGLTAEDRTGKAKKSHEAFVEKNLTYLEGIDTPVVNAYRTFIQNWKPEEETQNPQLLKLGKDFAKSNFIFCLSGYPDLLLQEDRLVKERWETEKEHPSGDADIRISQCAVGGAVEPIARIHNKIKGVYGGLATGSVLIGFNNASEGSYGLEQSYNSNISESVMKKYTEALNYLLSDSKHKVLLDDMTVVFWAMSENESNEALISAMLFGQADKMDVSQVEKMLESVMQAAPTGKITKDRLAIPASIDSDVDFYMVGFKPNSSRLAMKFIYRRRFADVLYHIARHQADMKMADNMRPVSFFRIRNELISPKSKAENVNPAILTKLFEAVLYGTDYPVSLLDTVVRRVKTDLDSDRNMVRTGIIKACINRNYAKKEELKVALNKDNDNQAYVCGRLFAVLEKLQQEASGNALNRTIKDAYFASAMSNPAMVFPKLLKLAQNHMNKVKRPVFFDKLISEIVGKVHEEFPKALSLQNQGRFAVGYYQQHQNFYEKTDVIIDEKEREEQ